MPGAINDSGVASVTAPTTSDTVIPPDFSLCRGGPLYRLGWRRFAATADSSGRVWLLPY